MKKADKLKRQRYEISMKIIELEAKANIKKLHTNELKELEILKQKKAELTERLTQL
ncbi:MAG: hypothetical protein K9G76_11265 [Bacteroidales bacterium]|nr:hypothetical protein [Bacteroidales bacterium]MCF8404973.1 hypothetical protein [Bacteroidales bacterium]